MTASLLLLVTPLVAPSYLRPPAHYRELKSRCAELFAEAGCANRLNERIFISVNLYDQGGRLASGQWGRAVQRLIQLLGPDNIFLSIYENDSGPEGVASLERFEAALPCRLRVVSDAHVPLDAFPTVIMPDGTKRMERLAYLSEMRNRAVSPLDTFPGG